MADESAGRQRIDKWLWHARVVRTRSSAAALVEAGHARLNGQRVTVASHSVRAGDVLTLTLDARVRVLEVTGFADRRGSAPQARDLYREAGASLSAGQGRGRAACRPTPITLADQ